MYHTHKLNCPMWLTYHTHKLNCPMWLSYHTHKLNCPMWLTYHTHKLNCPMWLSYHTQKLNCPMWLTYHTHKCICDLNDLRFLFITLCMLSIDKWSLDSVCVWIFYMINLKHSVFVEIYTNTVLLIPRVLI